MHVPHALDQHMERRTRLTGAAVTSRYDFVGQPPFSGARDENLLSTFSLRVNGAQPLQLRDDGAVRFPPLVLPLVAPVSHALAEGGVDFGDLRRGCSRWLPRAALVAVSKRELATAVLEFYHGVQKGLVPGDSLLHSPQLSVSLALHGVVREANTEDNWSVHG